MIARERDGGGVGMAMAEQFWQGFVPASPPRGVHRDRYPPTMPDGRAPVLPLRQLPAAPGTLARPACPLLR